MDKSAEFMNTIDHLRKHQLNINTVTYQIRNSERKKEKANIRLQMKRLTSAVMFNEDIWIPCW